MLPPILSENLGSLIPHENRLAVSLLWDVRSDGAMGTPTWTLSVIRCCEKLSYDEAEAILDDTTHPRHAMLSALLDAAESLLIQRVEAGAVAIDQIDRRVNISADGTVDIEIKKRDSRADLLVSELMVKANVEAAKLCVEQNAPAIFRVQDAPDLSDLEPTDHRKIAPLSGIDAHARGGNLTTTRPARWPGCRTLLPDHISPEAIHRPDITATTRRHHRQQSLALFSGRPDGTLPLRGRTPPPDQPPGTAQRAILDIPPSLAIQRPSI